MHAAPTNGAANLEMNPRSIPLQTSWCWITEQRPMDQAVVFDTRETVGNCQYIAANGEVKTCAGNTQAICEPIKGAGFARMYYVTPICQ